VHPNRAVAEEAEESVSRSAAGVAEEVAAAAGSCSVRAPNDAVHVLFRVHVHDNDDRDLCRDSNDLCHDNNGRGLCRGREGICL